MAKRHFKAHLLSSVGMMLIAASASAETTSSESASPDQSQANSSGLEEVVVTVQRRSESLSKTPVAVSFIGGEALAEAQIVSEQDLQPSVPGLQVRGTVNSEQLNYTLRGQTVDAFSGVRPGVLPYINEVQIGGAGTSSAFYDLQSVQVLKGPQGILFGRSATGGAVLFTTQKPTDTFGGYVQGTAGNYATGRFEGAVNVPIVEDKVLLRVAGLYQRRHDGYQYNLFNGQGAGTTEREGARASLTLNFSDRLRDELVVDYFYSYGVAMGSVLSGLPKSALLPLSYLYAGTATPAATATGIATLQAFTGLSTAAATAQYNAYFADPKHFPAGIAAFLDVQKARGPYTADLNTSPSYRNNNAIATNATTFEINDNTRIKNILGYTNLVNRLLSDTDATPYALAESAPPGQLTRTRQLSEEIQVLGDTFNNRLNYVTGLYFSDEHVNYDAFFVNLDILGGGGLRGETVYRQNNRTYAAYAHSTYRLTDNGLSVNAGLRYTSERVEDINLPNDNSHVFCTVPGYDCDQSHTYNKLSWQIGLQDQISSDFLLYAVSRRAYKSGGFNPTVAPKVGTGEVGGSTFLAEQVTDVELGAKFRGRTAGMPVRLNTALFHDWEDNSQRQAFVLLGFEPNGVTANVPKGTTYGVEVDGQIEPVEWLTLGGSGSYLHADFSGVTHGSTALPGCRGATVYGSCYDQVPDAPKFAGSIYGDVTVPVSDDLVATVHGDVYHQTSTTISTQSSNGEGTNLPAYTIADFRVGIESKSRGWSVTANVKNAFNEVYYTGGIPLGVLEFNTLLPAEPRTYSITARIKF
jgi:iron complex outermembrane receptor protein